LARRDRHEQHQTVSRVAADSSDADRPHHDSVPAKPGILIVTDRRTFLKASAAGVAAVLTPLPPLPTVERGSEQVRLGVASSPLRKFTRAKAMQMVIALVTPCVYVKSVHLPSELVPEEF